jgi:cell division protein FtsQ
MARKSSSTIAQDELYSAADEPVRPELDDARLLDLDADEESPFLRAQRRVSVRRGSLPKKTATRLVWGALALTVALFCSMAVAALYHYGEHSWRFRIESSDSIQIVGLDNVTRSQVLDVMGGDIGRNIFFVPLAERKKQLEQIPWVQSASVMRFVPNRLEVVIRERTPVAFARVGSRILLIDVSGVLMELPTSGKKYSFPVILGTNPGEPLSTRLARMKIYNDLIRQLDSGGAHYSQDLSEVDLSDPEDVKVLTNDPQGEVLIHLGSSNYLERYKIYVTHVQEWRQQFQKLESVDLRYDRQIIVNPDLAGTIPQPRLSPATARAAMQAGVKRAALVSREKIAHEKTDHEKSVHAIAPPKPAAPALVKTLAKVSARSRKAPGRISDWKPAKRAKARAVRKTAARKRAVSHSARSTTKTKASTKPSPEIKGQEQD